MKHGLKAEMVRIAANGDKIELDEQSRMDGRGGYLHRREECLARFARSKVKEFRSLRRRISLEQRVTLTELMRSRLASKLPLE